MQIVLDLTPEMYALLRTYARLVNKTDTQAIECAITLVAAMADEVFAHKPPDGSLSVDSSHEAWAAFAPDVSKGSPDGQPVQRIRFPRE
jgi:hypothetical protein